MLEFAKAPDPEGLELALSVRLRWYLRGPGRRHLEPGERRRKPRLFERAPLSLIPERSIRDVKLAELLGELSAVGLWHVQIRRRTRRSEGGMWVPRYYARARYDGEEWRVLWIGEAWLAEQVGAAIRKLDRLEGQLPDSAVRVVSSRAYQFTSLWIEAIDRHLVASASEPLREMLPVGEYLDGEELQHRLVEHFGDRFDAEGIGGFPG